MIINQNLASLINLSKPTQEDMKLRVLPQPLRAFSATHTILRNLQRSGMKPAIRLFALPLAYSPFQPLSNAIWAPSVHMSSAAAWLTLSPLQTKGSCFSLLRFLIVPPLQASSMSSPHSAPVCVFAHILPLLRGPRVSTTNFPW